MRIIGGKLRHRLIKLPTTRETRATKDAVREAIFSALGPAVAGRVALDLFAGSGSFGLEALSRGAAQAVFADHNDICIKTIDDNIHALDIDNAIVWHRDYLDALAHARKEGLLFGLVFLDPPYLDKLCEKVIDMMFEDGLLAEDAIIVTETQKEIIVDETRFAKVRRYRYGITCVAIMWR